MALNLQIRAFGNLNISPKGTQENNGVQENRVEATAPSAKNLSTKAQALLCYLGLTKQSHTREQISGLLWAEDPEKKAKNSLRVALNNLRASYPDCIPVGNRQPLALKTGIIGYFDVDEFDRIVNSLPLDDDEVAMAAIEKAISLYRNDLLTSMHVKDSVAFQSWLELERDQRRQQVMRLFKRQIKFLLDSRRYVEAHQSLQRQLQIEPWNEEAHQQMMLTLCRLGDLNGALRQYKLCRQSLKDELDVEPMPKTTAVHERILAARTKPLHNLPAETTSFVGRPSEINALHHLLTGSEHRLVTVLGLGGVGKTSLALHVAHLLHQEQALTFINGVFFVSLVSIRSLEQLLATIADVLNIPLRGDADSLPQIIESIRNQELLLALDDWESLLYSLAKFGSSSSIECVNLIRTLLESCPHLHILITSREPLQLRIEKRFVLEGLAIPPDDAIAIEEFDSVQLFLQVAKRAVPDFSVTDENRPHIIQICKVLEGMPLAIDLAAAWVRTLSCKRIAAEIEDLDFLAATMGDVPDRQHSLRAVFEYSWQLMNDQERNVFMRLAVFADVFTESAAADIAGLTPLVLRALVDRSLIRHTTSIGAISTSDAPTFYSLHNVVRHYAFEKLSEDKELQSRTRQKHSRYYANFIEQERARLYTDDHSLALALIKQEKQNALSAWAWALHYMQFDELEKIIGAIQEYFTLAGPYKEAELSARLSAEYLSNALEQAENPEPQALIIFGKILAYRARFLLEMSEFNSGLVTAKELLALAKELNSVELRAQALNLSGLAHHRLGEIDLAVAEYQESLKLAQEAKLKRIIASNLRRLGIIYQSQAEYRKVQEVLGSELIIRRSINDRRGEMVNLSNSGVWATQRGDYAQALHYYNEALDLFKKIGDLGHQSHTLNNIGRIYSEQRKFTDAALYIKQAIEMKRSLGDKWGESNALLSEGRNYLFLGVNERAREIHEHALNIKREMGDWRGEAEALTYLALIHCAKGEPQTAFKYITLAATILERNTERFIEAQMMTVRSHILLHQGELPEAKEAATSALAEWRARENVNLSMEAIANLAEIEFIQENHQEAHEYVDQILMHIETGNLDGVNFPLKIYLTCYNILTQSNDPRAEKTLELAYDKLQAWSSTIEDAALRDSYLAINHHRQIIELSSLVD